MISYFIILWQNNIKQSFRDKNYIFICDIFSKKDTFLIEFKKRYTMTFLYYQNLGNFQISVSCYVISQNDNPEATLSYQMTI